MRSRLPALLVLSCLALAPNALARQASGLKQGDRTPPLKAGDPAPPLLVSYWAKEAKGPALEPGRTSVVCFLSAGESLADDVTRSTLNRSKWPSDDACAGGVDALADLARAYPQASVFGVLAESLLGEGYREPDPVGLASWLGERASFPLGSGQASADAWLRGSWYGPWTYVVRDGRIVWAGLLDEQAGLKAALDRLEGGPALAPADQLRRLKGFDAIMRAARRRYESGNLAGGAKALADAESRYPEYAARVSYEAACALSGPKNEAAFEAWGRVAATSGRPGDRAGLLRFAMRAWHIRGFEERARRAMAIALETGPDDYATQRTAVLFYRNQEDAAAERRAIEGTLALLPALPSAQAKREQAWLLRRLKALGGGSSSELSCGVTRARDLRQARKADDAAHPRSKPPAPPSEEPGAFVA